MCRHGCPGRGSAWGHPVHPARRPAIAVALELDALALQRRADSQYVPLRLPGRALILGS